MSLPVDRRRRGRGPSTSDSTALPNPPHLPVNPPEPSLADITPTAGRRVTRARRQPTRFIPGPREEDGEEFDINAHSDVSEEDLDSGPPHRHGPDHRNLHRGAVAIANPPTVTDPLATNRSTSSTTVDPLASNVSSKSNRALDIEYFFRKEKEDTTCKECESIAAKLAAKGEPYKTQYRFSPKTSNTPLRYHVEVNHPLVYLEQAELHGWVIGVKFAKRAFLAGYTFNTLKRIISQPGVKLDDLPPPPPPDPSDRLPVGIVPQQSSTGVDLPPFSVEGLQEHIVRYLVANDVAINQIDSVELRRLLLFCCPRNISNSDIPHRTKTHELILDAFGKNFAALRAELLTAVGEISFTADIWSSDTLDPYLAITAHWIGQDAEAGTYKLDLKCALIAFHYIPGSHTGAALAKKILELIDRAQIPLGKIGHFTMDNASNNDTAMSEFSRILQEEREFTFDATERRLRCLPHIYNICVQRTLDKYMHADFNQRPRAWKNSAGKLINKAEYIEALHSDPIGRGRSVVRSIRSSGQRRANFKQTIISGNEQGWFVNEQGGGVALPEVVLLRDVKTRWDSTYFMINRLRTLEQAVDYFLDAPRNADIADRKLEAMEWQVLQDMEVVLEIPALAQETMCGERMPLLSGAIPSYETFLSQWQTLSSSPEFPQLGPFISEGLNSAIQYNNRLRQSNAYLFAMFVDPCIRISWVDRHWEEDAIVDAKASIRQKIEEYRIKYPIQTTAPSQPTQAVQPRAFMTLGARYGLTDMAIGTEEQGIQSVDQEYNTYVTSSLAHAKTSPLAFWALERHRYPTIFRMAMDYLSVQPSSVPCERAFSSSGLTDTKQRNRINPVLMEALQILKFSLKKERPNLRWWRTSQEEMLRDEDSSQILATTIRSDGAHGNIEEVLKAVLTESLPVYADVY